MSRKNPWWYLSGNLYVLALFMVLLSKEAFPSLLTTAMFWGLIGYGSIVLFKTICQYYKPKTS
jgi:hypothetical protein